MTKMVEAAGFVGFVANIVKRRDRGETISYTFLDGERYFNVVFHKVAKVIIQTSTHILGGGQTIVRDHPMRLEVAAPSPAPGRWHGPQMHVKIGKRGRSLTEYGRRRIAQASKLRWDKWRKEQGRNGKKK